MRLYSIGHSTRSTAEFLELLGPHRIERLVDIRRFPASRRHPQFSRDALAAALEEAGIEYRHAEALGGRRQPRPDSRNMAWRHEQFRGYADHMATDEFRVALDSILASDKIMAFLCAEAVPWRCHRNLLADELTRRGHEVIHILDAASTRPHTMNLAARDAGDHLVYPGATQSSLTFRGL